MEGRPVDVARHGGVPEEGLRLGREGEEAAPLPIVEGLLAQAVAREEQGPPRAVPEGEREHAAQALDARLAERGVRLEDHLGVALRPESPTARLELRPELAEVVDLAVEHEPEALVGVAHRLPPRDEVDDREPRHAERHAGLSVDAHVVGPAMAEQVEHRRQEIRRRLADEAGDAAHQRGLPATRASSSSTRPAVRSAV